MKRVLITGAAGEIGRVLRDGLAGLYPVLRLADVKPLGPARPGEEIFQGDITDLSACEEMCRDVDAVVHLAGIPIERPWQEILPANLIGCYHVFEAARRQGVKRMVYASSNHAVGYYRRDQVSDTDVLPRPDGLYGVSKVYGEALGRLYADKHGMQVACLRIASFRPRPENLRALSTWISHRDMVQLTRRCLDAADYHFCVVYGISNNRRAWWDNSKVAWLGYAPQDDAEDYAAELLAAGEVEDPVAARYHGGPFCALDFAGNIERIDRP